MLLHREVVASPKRMMSFEPQIVTVMKERKPTNQFLLFSK